MIWVLILLGAASIWLFVPIVVKEVQIIRLKKRCRVERAIVLTYDDGPSARVTGALLDVLRSHDARATFFVKGSAVEQVGDVFAEVISAGHEIGSHSYGHLHAWRNNPLAVYVDIRKGLQIVRAVSACMLFRAPYGKLTVLSLIQAWLSGCQLAWWTIDSTDTWVEMAPAPHLIDRIRQSGGGVILMHDHGRQGHPEREGEVIALTREILDMAHRERYRICTVGELLSIRL